MLRFFVLLVHIWMPERVDPTSILWIPFSKIRPRRCVPLFEEVRGEDENIDEGEYYECLCPGEPSMAGHFEPRAIGESTAA